MNMIYDSDTFVVVHVNANDGCEGLPARHCFEIVNKTLNKEIFLHDDLAQTFDRYIKAWQENLPDSQTVERVLAGYTEFAQLPLITH
jgi:hypothetical protein